MYFVFSVLSKFFFCFCCVLLLSSCLGRHLNMAVVGRCGLLGSTIFLLFYIIYQLLAVLLFSQKIPTQRNTGTKEKTWKIKIEKTNVLEFCYVVCGYWLQLLKAIFHQEIYKLSFDALHHHLPRLALDSSHATIKLGQGISLATTRPAQGSSSTTTILATTMLQLSHH